MTHDEILEQMIREQIEIEGADGVLAYLAGLDVSEPIREELGEAASKQIIGIHEFSKALINYAKSVGRYDLAAKLMEAQLNVTYSLK